MVWGLPCLAVQAMSAAPWSDEQEGGLIKDAASGNGSGWTILRNA
jgi:hypothetical protein